MSSKWISVETPPKKCGLFLCWDENYSHNYPFEVFRYEIYNDQWSYAGDEFHPQFWQPLPLPPAEEPNSISNKSTPNVMVGEDELVGVFAEIFGKHDRVVTNNPQPNIALRHAKECAKVATEHHQSKLEELIKWIEEKTFGIQGYFGSNHVVVDVEDLKSKIKSLK